MQQHISEAGGQPAARAAATTPLLLAAPARRPGSAAACMPQSSWRPTTHPAPRTHRGDDGLALHRRASYAMCSSSSIRLPLERGRTRACGTVQQASVMPRSRGGQRYCTHAGGCCCRACNVGARLTPHREAGSLPKVTAMRQREASRPPPGLGRRLRPRAPLSCCCALPPALLRCSRPLNICIVTAAL